MAHIYRSTPAERLAASKPKELLSWVSPLPDYTYIPEANRTTVQRLEFHFLSAFLSETCKVDLPFLMRQGLANFLLGCTEKACHAWMQKWHPLHLELLGIREPDELDLGG